MYWTRPKGKPCAYHGTILDCEESEGHDNWFRIQYDPDDASQPDEYDEEWLNLKTLDVKAVDNQPQPLFQRETWFLSGK